MALANVSDQALIFHPSSFVISSQLKGPFLLASVWARLSDSIRPLYVQCIRQAYCSIIQYVVPRTRVLPYSNETLHRFENRPIVHGYRIGYRVRFPPKFRWVALSSVRNEGISGPDRQRGQCTTCDNINSPLVKFMYLRNCGHFYFYCT